MSYMKQFHHLNFRIRQSLGNGAGDFSLVGPNSTSSLGLLCAMTPIWFYVDIIVLLLIPFE